MRLESLQFRGHSKDVAEQFQRYFPGFQVSVIEVSHRLKLTPKTRDDQVIVPFIRRSIRHGTIEIGYDGKADEIYLDIYGDRSPSPSAATKDICPESGFEEVVLHLIYDCFQHGSSEGVMSRNYMSREETHEPVKIKPDTLWVVKLRAPYSRQETFELG